MPTIHQLIGLSKSQVLKSINDTYVEFAHWVYIPALSALLSFEKQCCVGVDFV